MNHLQFREHKNFNNYTLYQQESDYIFVEQLNKLEKLKS